MGARKQRDCEVCGVRYRPTYSDQRTCGRTCGVELQHRNGAAVGKSYGGKVPGRTCRRCGKRSLSVKSSGQRCEECRTVGLAPRMCDVCGNQFAPTSASVKRCSAACRRKANIRSITTSITERYRSDPAFRDRVITAAQNRRASRLGVAEITTQAELVSYLLRRDRGRCGICRKPVRARKGPMRPSIDHIVPLSIDRNHTLENVQLAHYRCNLSKGDRGGGEQLLLIG